MKKLNSVQVKDGNGKKYTLRSDEEKKRIIEFVESATTTKKEACKKMGICSHQIYEWKKAFAKVSVSSDVKVTVDMDDFNYFMSENFDEIKEKIRNDYEKWRKTDLICYMRDNIKDVKEVAKGVGIDENLLRSILERKVDPKLSVINKILKYLKLPILV